MSVLVALQGGAGAVDSTGSWTQAAAMWDATAAETITTTASWSQATATWSASAAETDTSTGSWTQAAATWSASLTETITSTASFVQAAASWDATADSAVNSFAGSWTQAIASWDATADTPLPTGGTGGKFGPRRFLRPVPAEPVVEPVPHLVMAAAFAQPPASWRADMDTYDPDLLALLFDEPALIGAR